ncbi:hypothetical protein Pcinc_008699 [Petrolisthes cinctipes]|uniref:Uncharacterized protein n=1 Tax=Petrolisthes cinctipes TaxID=88211 RepID=A0AAE1G8V3_PETCI|nr:hypothetical protein Pcinc_008699 [Petrolisthes cinctipes]
MSEQKEVGLEKGMVKEGDLVLEEKCSKSTVPKTSVGGDDETKIPAVGNTLSGSTEVSESMEKDNNKSEGDGKDADGGKSVSGDETSIAAEVEKCSVKDDDDVNAGAIASEMSAGSEISAIGAEAKTDEEGKGEIVADPALESVAEDVPKKSKNQLKREKKRALYNQMKDEYKEKRRQKKLLKEKQEMEEMKVWYYSLSFYILNNNIDILIHI